MTGIKLKLGQILGITSVVLQPGSGLLLLETTMKTISPTWKAANERAAERRKAVIKQLEKRLTAVSAKKSQNDVNPSGK